MPQYIKRIKEGGLGPHPHPSLAQAVEIDLALEMAETMILGLRLTRQGVSRTDFKARFERSVDEVFGLQLKKLKSLDLLHEQGPAYTIDPTG